MPSMCKNIWIPDLMLTTNKDGKICMRRLFEGGVIFVGNRRDMHKRINWSSVHTCDFDALCDRHCTSKIAINISIFHLGSYARHAHIAMPRRDAYAERSAPCTHHCQCHCPPGPSCEFACSLCSSGIVLHV